MNKEERASHIRNLQLQGQQFGKWLTQLCLLGLFPDVKSTIGNTITLRELKGGGTPNLENLTITDQGERHYEMGVPDEISDRQLNTIDIEEFAAIGRNYAEHLDDEFIEMVQQQVQSEQTLQRRVQALDIVWTQMRRNVSYETKRCALDSTKGGQANIPMFRMDTRAMDVKPQNRAEVSPYLIVVCDQALSNITEPVRVKRFGASEHAHTAGKGVPDTIEHTPTSTYLIYREEPVDMVTNFLKNQVARENVEAKAKHTDEQTEHLFEASDKPNNIEQPDAPEIPEQAPGEPAGETSEQIGTSTERVPADEASPSTQLGEHNLTSKGNG